MELEIAYIFDDADSRIEGLQHKRLGFDQCALFVYGSPNLPKFWMKGVNYNLYLSAIVGGECVESNLMKCRSTAVHPVLHKTMCVVESRVGIPVGSKVDIVGDRLVVS